jgi:hypothetical protein
MKTDLFIFVKKCVSTDLRHEQVDNTLCNICTAILLVRLHNLHFYRLLIVHFNSHKQYLYSLL